MKEIANTGFLVSVKHSSTGSANLEVFDISRKRKTMEIYSFEEVSGGNSLHLFPKSIFQGFDPELA